MIEVTAKIECTSKSLWQDGETASLSFAPDYADGRNAEWAAATPALNLSMTVKGGVSELFGQGRKYTLTFTPADEVDGEPEAAAAADEQPLGEPGE